GPSQAIFPMCAALRAQGIDAAVASTDAEIDATLPRKAFTTHKGVPVILFPRQLGNSMKYSRALSTWLTENVSNYDVVHIHAVFNHSCIAAARACRKHGVPYVVRPLGTLDPWSMNQKSLRKSVFWKVAGNRMMQNAAAVHYTARAEKQAVEESLGLNHGRVVPLGVDLTVTQGNGLQRTEFPQLTGHPYVLVLSRLHSKKGLDVLLESFIPLVKQEEFSNWRLVIAGDGPSDYSTKLKQQVRAAGAEEFVLFTGWLEGAVKESVLRNASLLALPSRHENFGLCVLEALAYGVPVLISPHVNLAEDIQSANAGWIAPVDKESIQSALSETMRSTEERRTRGNAGKKFAAQFAWPNVAAQLVELYGNIV
ncbi:MAG TPA: glycosyltransferase, partial [Pyrinomonadaceae bacterium]|nr:glycosyltransferase [Pyrinomonadaceae bacterium]